ncbi:hypothetical protein [Microbacterium sp. 2FI]|uniref:hypothetical protein n=1 Tax=Microbacterium sp. 2FI TaxID=2502193 RepID=UPI0010F4414D|nr:hypothetical protein [Microbacterium sp. 2FI]
MSIEASITVTLASVEVDDEYRIALTTHTPRTTYTWDEATQLANELISAIEDARRMLGEDFPIENFARLAGFDAAPVCRDCSEGKHGACIGSAFIERGPDIDEVECGCSRVGHQVHGKAV